MLELEVLDVIPVEAVGVCDCPELVPIVKVMEDVSTAPLAVPSKSTIGSRGGISCS
jgi:hypothetical protein